MKITEVTISPTNDGVVRAYVDIVFDNWLMVRDIKVIQGPTGLFVSFPATKQRDGTHRQLAYPGNAETRMMIQRIILGEYEQIFGSDPPPSVRSVPERLRALEQLKTDGLVNEEEYNTKRKKILGEL
jgi:stage V sporulation protein G